MSKLIEEAKQKLIKEILEELACNSTRFISNENSYDEYECKHCFSSVRWDSNKSVVHDKECLYTKAWLILDSE